MGLRFCCQYPFIIYLASDNSNNSSVVSSIILSAIANETVVPHANGLSDSDDNKEDDELFNRYVR